MNSEKEKEIENLREMVNNISERLPYADGQAYYQDLDRIAELNTLIKELQEGEE